MERHETDTIKLPLALPHDKWAVVCLDPRQCFERYHCMHAEEQYFLKSLMLCDNIKVSRIAASDTLYDFASLPRDLNFDLDPNTHWLQVYAWIEPTACHSPEVTNKYLMIPSAHVFDVNIENYKKEVDEEVKVMEYSRNVKGDRKKRCKELMEMRDVIGCNLDAGAHWLGEEFVYAVGNLVVVSDLKGNKRFGTGHSECIKALAVNREGNLIASACESSVRLWSCRALDCISTWKLKDKPKLLALTRTYLLMIQAQNNQDSITIQLLNQPLALPAKQISEFAVYCVKPINESLFCACGYNAISLWSIDNETISAVALENPFDDEVYTAMDYNGRHLYVGSRKGRVAKLNAVSYEVEGRYKLHGGLCTLSVNEEVCAVGSGRHLRIWPLNFEEDLMEVKHDGDITFTEINGQNVLCGCTAGMMGVLKMDKQQYETIARGHTSEVLSLLATKDLIISSSKDGTIRLWNAAKQVCEYKANKDEVLCMCTCAGEEYFACGFSSGFLRIFSVRKCLVVGEFRLCAKPLIDINYLDSYLLALNSDRSLSIHDALTCTLVQHFPQETSANSIAVCTSNTFATTTTTAVGIKAVSYTHLTLPTICSV
eukprot:TRINITY_DN5735_c0_g1_i2.p1 TRINITY_DN5735_c0_g1~~TRINITY_DN5735_c0_g1_i2.p1  ORF type:complete len:599 (+),score=72.72 TRINITY_DN5735_c0_g1_i2:475-2271(+)